MYSGSNIQLILHIPDSVLQLHNNLTHTESVVSNYCWHVDIIMFISFGCCYICHFPIISKYFIDLVCCNVGVELLQHNFTICFIQNPLHDHCLGTWNIKWCTKYRLKYQISLINVLGKIYLQFSHIWGTNEILSSEEKSNYMSDGTQYI